MPHTQTWQMPYSVGSRYLNRVFEIPTGLFVLHLFINDDGEIRACVLMNASGQQAQKYSYKIEIECGGSKVSYIENVSINI